MGKLAAAVDNAADDCATARVVVLGYGRGEDTGLAAGHGQVFKPGAACALYRGPSIVFAAGTGRGLEVELFAIVVPGIRDVEVAGPVVEGETPRVPESKGPDFRAELVVGDEGIAGGDLVGLGLGLDINAQYLSQQ